MKKLKLFFACLLMAVLSIGQVWALANTYTKVTDVASLSNGDKVVVAQGSSAPATGVTGWNGSKDATVSTTESDWVQYEVKNASATGWQLYDAGADNYIKSPGSSNQFVYGAAATCSVSDAGVLMCNNRYLVQNSSYYRMYGSVGSYTPFYVWKVDAGEDPTITLKQSNTAISKLDVAATSVANQAIDLEYANFAGSISSVTTKLYEESTCETEITSGAWVTDITINAAKTQLTFNLDDNDGAARQVWLKVSATDGAGNASAVLNIKQAKYEAPFTGEVLEITKDNFASGSYAANDGGITVEGFDFAVKDMYKNSNIIQAKASSGYIYNESVFGEIVKIEITKSGAGNNNFTVYEGTTEHPLTTSVSGDVDGTTTTYEFSEDQTYFTLKNGSTYSTVNPIKIYYYPIKSAVTIDNSIENGSVGVTGAADLTQVAVGTELTLTNTPDASYKLEAYDVYKTGETTTKITITDGKFIMPAYGVTVSGSFELARDLTSIAISAEASKKTYLVGETFSSAGLEITASFSNAADAVVTPTSISSPDMSTAGVKTITISYTEGANTETTSYDITVKDAYTVTEILPMVPALNAGSLATRVKGYISQIDQYNSTYKSITYWISVDGKTTSDQLEVYSGKNVGNTDFSSIDDLAVGDFVTISGEVKTHTNGVKEFDKNNYIITGGRIQKGAVTTVTVSGTPTKTEYAANETFDPAGLVVTATYANGFSTVVTEGITWGNDLTDGKVTESTTVHVTATVSEIASPAYDVAVTVAAKTLVSIAVGTDAYTIYTGEALPQPVVTATFSEGDPEDVSAFAVYDSENVFDTEILDNPDPQTITVSYTFGGETKTATYTVSVKDYANNVNQPYTVAEALYIITNAIGTTNSARDIFVKGIVCQKSNPSSGSQTYYISEDGTTTTKLEIYKGKSFEGASFTADNKVLENDTVIVGGKVVNYQGNTPEFVTGESSLFSQIRPATFAIAEVTGFEVGATDLEVADLTVESNSDGDVTLVSSDNEGYVDIVEGALHAVAPGTAIITANLAATNNENALNYAAAVATFNVTVIAAQTKYAISFDGNGADGGDAPEAIADKAAGAEVALPANTYTYTGHSFAGWKVYDENNDEVPVTEGVFEMPASPVTIKAQWAEISVWAYTYTSNVTIASNEEKQVTIDGDDYPAAKSNKGTSATITLPQGVTKIHLHLVAWKSEAQTVTVSGDCFNEAKELTILANDAVSGTAAKYDLGESGVDYYFSLTPDNAVAANEVITITAASNKRFVLFGVNQEGGVLPVLESIEIKGDLENKTGYKAGDALNLDGLTVEATYSLGGVDQTPVDITDKLGDGLTLTYDPLVENQTEVTITASYEGKTDDITITGLEVASADPNIYVDPSLYVNFGSVDKDAALPADQTITVTLTNVAAGTATLAGDDVFNIDKTALVEGENVITISVASTATAGEFSATITLTDNASAAPQKVVNLSFTVNEPVTPEDPEVRKTWDLSIASYDANPTEAQVTWSATYVNMVADKASSTTAANNYLGGDANNRTSSRFYKNSTLTITPNAKEITSVVFTATSTSYANALQGSEWTNASASVDGTTVTVTPTDGKNAIIAVIGNTCGFTAVQVNYKNIAPEPPVEDWVEVRTGLEVNRHYTVCLENNVTAVKGATFWNLTYKNSANTEVYLEEVALPEAGKPYIFQATAEKLEVVYGEESVEDPVANGALRGTFSYLDAAALNTINETEDNVVYMLFENALRPLGTNNHLDAHRAYVLYNKLEPVPAQGFAPGRRVKSMPLQPQTPTGCENIEANDKPVKMIIDGQLFILRGEKMYDATGRLVK